MIWMRRVFLFLSVNFLVIMTVSVLLNILGVKPYLTAYGIDYQSLLAFCLIWGMGGAFISLALSRIVAKWMMGVHVIDPHQTTDLHLHELLTMVHRLSRQAGLKALPEVGIYDSPEINAFATGPTQSRSLVAVSTGLVARMKRDEMEGVLGHEVSHIANGDMVTMTLLQGVVNAFAMFLARAIAFAVSQVGGRREGQEEGSFSYGTYFLIQFVLEMFFMIMGSIVIAWYSRRREFRADSGGARLAGRDKMINALQALWRNYEATDITQQPAVQTLKISTKGHGVFHLFSTHPPLEERISRLASSGIEEVGLSRSA